MNSNGHLKIKDQKRSDILKTALNCFLEDGYGETSLNTIREKFGGSKTTLYNNFSCKNELLKALIELQSVYFEQNLLDFLSKIPTVEMEEWLVSVGLAYRQALLDTHMTSLMGFLPSSSASRKTTNGYFIFTITQHPASLICNSVFEHFNVRIRPENFSYFVKQISQAWMFRQWLGQPDSNDDIKLAVEHLLMSHEFNESKKFEILG